MNGKPLTDPSDVLTFGVVPPSIDVSTPANPQVFNPQFGIANIGAAAVSITRALLQVPVTTQGTNLALNTDMAPSASGNWILSHSTGGKPGYAAFALLPKDGSGSIPPGGSVAFMLTGVKVATVPGRAALALEASTSDGGWSPDAFIELTAPSTTPTIVRYSVTPANPQTLKTRQGQSVIIRWTTTGAAYCTLEDDQGKMWPKLPTGDSISDTPAVGTATIRDDPVMGRYYHRTYTLTAYAAGAQDADQKPNATIIQLPTILSFSVTPKQVEKVGDTVTVSWSVCGLDPDTGRITLSIAPTDGTGPYTVDISPSPMSGSAVVTPTPLTATTYSLAVDGGPGGIAPPLPPQSVASTLAPGFVPVAGSPPAGSRPILAAFAGQLWCAHTAPGLYWTADGTGWTAVTPQPALPPIDGLVVKRDGAVETLWAFGTGGNTPFVASSADGRTWTMQPTPPYPPRYTAAYATNAGRLYVAGGYLGQTLNDVWSSLDGCAWVKEGEQFTGIGSGNPPLAAFAGDLWAIRFGGDLVSFGTIKSSDRGATWVPQPNVPTAVFVGFTLQAVGDQLWLLGAGSSMTAGPLIMAMERDGPWTTLGLRTPHSFQSLGSALSAQVFADRLWLGCTGHGLQFCVLNQVLPGTTFTLVPTTESASE